VAGRAGANLSAAGLGRLAADTLLLAGALSAVALLVVAWLRSTAAGMPLAVLAAGSYLLVYLVRLFAWPDWGTRLSFVGAYANPYLELPPRSGMAVLAILTVAGGLLAAAVAQRSPKTA
jgi:hypothetical protein